MKEYQLGTIDQTKAKILEFASMCQALVEVYDNPNDPIWQNFVDECYPFTESLDEVALKLMDWATKDKE